MRSITPSETPSLGSSINSMGEVVSRLSMPCGSATIGSPKSMLVFAASENRGDLPPPSTIGNADIAASQLPSENVADGDSDTIVMSPCFHPSIGSSAGFSLVCCSSTGAGSLSSARSVDASLVVLFSDEEVGHMPSCSYRSKNDELVGGALRDMLVDLERGSKTAPDALRLTGLDTA